MKSCKGKGRAVTSHRVGVQVYLHSFVTSSVGGDGWSTLCLGHFTPGTSPGAHFTVLCAGPRADLHKCEEHQDSCLTGFRSPKRPAGSNTLYRLHHAGPKLMSCVK